MNKFHLSPQAIIFAAILFMTLAGFVAMLPSRPAQAEPPGLIAQIQDAAQRDPSFIIEISVSHTAGKEQVGGRLVYVDDSYLCLRPADSGGNLDPYNPAETCVPRSNIADITLTKALHSPNAK